MASRAVVSLPVRSSTRRSVASTDGAGVADPAGGVAAAPIGRTVPGWGAGFAAGAESSAAFAACVEIVVIAVTLSAPAAGPAPGAAAAAAPSAAANLSAAAPIPSTTSTEAATRIAVRLFGATMVSTRVGGTITVAPAARSAGSANGTA